MKKKSRSMPGTCLRRYIHGFYGYTNVRASHITFCASHFPQRPTAYGLQGSLCLFFVEGVACGEPCRQVSHLSTARKRGGGKGHSPCSTSYSAVSSSSSSSSHLFSPCPSSVIPITSSRERAAYRAKKRASYLPGLFPASFSFVLLHRPRGLEPWGSR